MAITSSFNQYGPLHAITQGFLCSPGSVSSYGYLCLVYAAYGGPSPGSGTEDVPYNFELRRIIEWEEEEILVLLISATELNLL